LLGPSRKTFARGEYRPDSDNQGLGRALLLRSLSQRLPIRHALPNRGCSVTPFDILLDCLLGALLAILPTERRFTQGFFRGRSRLCSLGNYDVVR
jgi:hypothetical protein